MKIETKVKAGLTYPPGPSATTNPSQAFPPGPSLVNHNQTVARGLKVKTRIKAGTIIIEE
jgi:hypothetical protein